MNVTPRFLRVCGASGILAGLGTAAILLLPQLYTEPGSIEDAVALQGNGPYTLRQWVSFLNVFAILLAGWGLAAHRFARATGPALIGALFLGVYAAAELLGRSVLVFARENRWIAELQTATGARRDELLALIESFDAIWASWFFVILVSFVLASAFLGWAARGGPLLRRVTSWGLLAASALGAVTLAAMQVPELRPLASIGYIVIQPTSRLLLGAFLWKEGSASLTAPAA